MDENKKFTFTFSLAEANTVLAALGDMPFRQVADLISSIKNQAEEQLLPPPPVEPSE